MSFLQTALPEFVANEENSSGFIYERLRVVYASSVTRWMKYFKDGNRTSSISHAVVNRELLQLIPTSEKSTAHQTRPNDNREIAA
jgi:hypothetical protein